VGTAAAAVPPEWAAGQIAGARAHLAASAGVGIIVGVVAAGALRHAHDPVAASEFMSLSGPEALLCLLVGVLIIGPAGAVAFQSIRLLLAVVLAAGVGGPALAVLLAVTQRGDACGGADRFIGWMLAVAAVHAVAGAVTAPRVRGGPVLVTAVVLVLAVSAVAALELGSQHRWRAWDIAHQDVALALPDVPGFEPTGFRFTDTGLRVAMSNSGDSLWVDLFNGEVSRGLGVSAPPGAVARRYGNRQIRIWPSDGARAAVSADVPLRPVSADRLARLPVLPPEYPD
jgi:hypothetical protein